MRRRRSEWAVSARQVAGTIHLWLGLMSGLVVFVVSLTGALIVFEEELSDLFYRSRRIVAPMQPDNPRAPPSAVFAAARGALPPGEYRQLYFIDEVQADRAHLLWAFHLTEAEYYAVALHPVTGEVLSTWKWAESPTGDFFAFVQRIHTSLLLGETGSLVIGCATFVYVFSLATGLVLWWPPAWRSLRPRLTLRLSGGRKRINYDLHNVLGFYLGWILMLVALTGLMFAFSWFSHAVQWVLDGGRPRDHAAPEAETTIIGSGQLGGAGRDFDRIYADLVQEFPEAERFVLEEPASPEGPIHLAVYPGRPWFRHTDLAIDPRSGARLEERSFSDLSLGQQARALCWDVHVGSLFGWPTKVLACAASLVSASLPVTGFLIWYPRWRRRRVLGATLQPRS